MTVLSVSHLTLYRYRQPVSFGEHRIMFRPRDSFDQKLIEATLDITPPPRDLRWLHDVSGNCVAVAEFAGKAAELRFESNIRLDHSPDNVPNFRIEDYALSYPFSYPQEEMPELVPRDRPPISPTPIRRSIAGSGNSCRTGARPNRRAADDAHGRDQGEFHLRVAL